MEAREKREDGVGESKDAVFFLGLRSREGNVSEKHPADRKTLIEDAVAELAEPCELNPAKVPEIPLQHSGFLA